MLATAANELKFSTWPQEDPNSSRILGVKSQIISFCWSADNKYAIFLEQGGCPIIASLKDMDSIKQVHKITAVNDATSILFQRTTKRIVAIARLSSNIALYNTREKKLEKLIALPLPATCMDLSETDKYLIVACHDGRILLLNFPDGTSLCNFRVCGIPSSISFHPKDEQLFAVGTKEGSLFAYETVNQERVYYTMLHDAEVVSVLFLIKSSNLLISAATNTFFVHNLLSRRCIFTGALHSSITCIDVTSAGEHFALGTEEGTVRIYKIGEYEVPMFKWKEHTCKITILKFAAGYKIPVANSSEPVEPESSSSTHPISSARRRMLNDGGLEAFCAKYMKNANEDNALTHLKRELVEGIYNVTHAMREEFADRIDSFTGLINEQFKRIEQREEKNWALVNKVLVGAQAEARAEHQPEMHETPESPVRPEGSLTTETFQMPVRIEISHDMSDISEGSERPEESVISELPESPTRSEGHS